MTFVSVTTIDGQVVQVNPLRVNKTVEDGNSNTVLYLRSGRKLVTATAFATVLAALEAGL
jgi:uncharacterized protein YlzI (FlbEa/FlbD family)